MTVYPCCANARTARLPNFWRLLDAPITATTFEASMDTLACNSSDWVIGYRYQVSDSRQQCGAVALS